jgi:hypothetical protein
MNSFLIIRNREFKGKDAALPVLVQAINSSFTGVRCSGQISRLNDVYPSTSWSMTCTNHEEKLYKIGIEMNFHPDRAALARLFLPSASGHFFFVVTTPP